MNFSLNEIRQLIIINILSILLIYQYGVYANPKPLYMKYGKHILDLISNINISKIGIMQLYI